MRVLYILLIVLCLTSLVLSDFVSVIIKCNTENDEHLEKCSATDQCMWKTSLEKCNSLELQCTDSNTKCSSIEECGMTNNEEFVKKLDVIMECKFYKKWINCTSKLSNEHTNILCSEHHCESRHTIAETKYCIFSHSFKTCIKENEQFAIKGDINCTVTHERKDKHSEKKENVKSGVDQCPPKPGCNETVYFHATIGLGITSSLVCVVLGLLFAFICWKRYRNGRGIERERNVPSPTLNSPHTRPLLGGTDAAMPISQHQDAAAAESILDDPQANAAMPVPKSQDGPLQMESSQVVKYKVGLEDE